MRGGLSYWCITWEPHTVDTQRVAASGTVKGPDQNNQSQRKQGFIHKVRVMAIARMCDALHPRDSERKVQGDDLHGA